MRQRSRQQMVSSGPKRETVLAPWIPLAQAKPSVLVVDSDDLARLMMQLGLERNGFEVWSAPSGRDAIELYREQPHRFGVVVLDLQMPGLDGSATLDALRKMNPDVPACFMSESVTPDETAELQKVGASRVIARPFQMNDLAKILRNLIRAESTDLIQVS